MPYLQGMLIVLQYVGIWGLHILFYNFVSLFLTLNKNIGYICRWSRMVMRLMCIVQS